MSALHLDPEEDDEEEEASEEEDGPASRITRRRDLGVWSSDGARSYPAPLSNDEAR